MKRQMRQRRPTKSQASRGGWREPKRRRSLRKVEVKWRQSRERGRRRRRILSQAAAQLQHWLPVWLAGWRWPVAAAVAVAVSAASSSSARCLCNTIARTRRPQIGQQRAHFACAVRTGSDKARARCSPLPLEVPPLLLRLPLAALRPPSRLALMAQAAAAAALLLLLSLLLPALRVHAHRATRMQLSCSRSARIQSSRRSKGELERKTSSSSVSSNKSRDKQASGANRTRRAPSNNKRRHE